MDECMPESKTHFSSELLNFKIDWKVDRSTSKDLRWASLFDLSISFIVFDSNWVERPTRTTQKPFLERA
uniref:Dehydrogenase/reductase SDR family member on chromosome X homolog isoform X2 n=1 Tax=Rhizophora mucronata TaxID=61149 RepID=A0A2P2KRB7_RHIMU